MRRMKMSSANAAAMLVVAVGAICHATAAAPTTTTAPFSLEPLVGGALRYQPPQGWDVVDKADRLARYRLPDETGFLEIAVDLLPSAVRKSAAQQMAMQIGKAIREQVKKDGNELVYGPRVEEDDRFFLK